jgi:hypothetical protein
LPLSKALLDGLHPGFYNRAMSSHDPAYRQFFSHPRMVQDLLLAFVHEDWVAELDFATLERVSGQFIAKQLKKRESDVIRRVCLPSLAGRWSMF